MLFIKKFIFFLCCLTVGLQNSLLASETSNSLTLKEENSFFAPTKKITFYTIQPSDSHNEIKKFGAFSVTSTESIESIGMKNHSSNSFYYTYPEDLSPDLFSSLENDCLSLSTAKKQENISIENFEPYPEQNVSDLVQAIKSCGVFCVSFGAGISHGFVPTLEESCSAFDLIKIPSSDNVTDLSMITFIQKLVHTPDNTLEKVKNIWGKINNCVIEQTPAHKALSQLITQTKKTKKVFVYTDNVDGIHTKCGIELSRGEAQFISENESVSEVIYPQEKDVNGKRVVSLIIGQSFDFDGIQSTIHTVSRKYAQEVQFYLLNIKQQPIKVWNGLDVNTAKLVENFDITTLHEIVLPTRIILGDIHKVLPETYSQYSENI